MQFNKDRNVMLFYQNILEFTFNGTDFNSVLICIFFCFSPISRLFVHHNKEEQCYNPVSRKLQGPIWDFLFLKSI
jgi:hypothetical protein